MYFGFGDQRQRLLKGSGTGVSELSCMLRMSGCDISITRPQREMAELTVRCHEREWLARLRRRVQSVRRCLSGAAWVATGITIARSERRGLASALQAFTPVKPALEALDPLQRGGRVRSA